MINQYFIYKVHHMNGQPNEISPQEGRLFRDPVYTVARGGILIL
ncbi:hypothetical protein [Bartonella phoceensis]|nr:hypothetical protein [Bartonella phoceensis]